MEMSFFTLEVVAEIYLGTKGLQNNLVIKLLLKWTELWLKIVQPHWMKKTEYKQKSGKMANLLEWYVRCISSYASAVIQCTVLINNLY